MNHVHFSLIDIICSQKAKRRLFFMIKSNWTCHSVFRDEKRIAAVQFNWRDNCNWYFTTCSNLAAWKRQTSRKLKQHQVSVTHGIFSNLKSKTESFNRIYQRFSQHTWVNDGNSQEKSVIMRIAHFSVLRIISRVQSILVSIFTHAFYVHFLFNKWNIIRKSSRTIKRIALHTWRYATFLALRHTSKRMENIVTLCTIISDWPIKKSREFKE